MIQAEGIVAIQGKIDTSKGDAKVKADEVMEPAARMFVSSTYWSDTIGLRAALTTLREIRKRQVPDQLHALGHTRLG